MRYSSVAVALLVINAAGAYQPATGANRDDQRVPMRQAGVSEASGGEIVEQLKHFDSVYEAPDGGKNV